MANKQVMRSPIMRTERPQQNSHTKTELSQGPIKHTIAMESKSGLTNTSMAIRLDLINITIQKEN